MQVFTVQNGQVERGAALHIHTLSNGMTIPVVAVGEEGRGRKQAMIPVANVPRSDDAPGRLLYADLGSTKSGGPKLIARQEPGEDTEAIVVFETGIGYRGSNAHTGDRAGWKCRRWGCKAEGDGPLPETCPDCGHDVTIRFAPFPGRILATGVIAQGNAGRMGSGEQIIAIVPKNVVFRTGYSGRLYGTPAAHYYIFDGEQLLAVTWGERMATDILPLPYAHAPRPEPVNAVSIADVLALAAKLPAGLPDTGAIDKLQHERGELQVALIEGDRSGTLTEVADVAYYAIKAIHEAASAAGLTVEQALAVCEAKYRLRARPGNPKDDEAERAAVLAALGE